MDSYPEEQIDRLEKRSKLFITRIFGDTSPYLKEVDEIFNPSFGVILWDAPPEAHMRKHIQEWERKRPQLLNTFTTILEDCQLSVTPKDIQPSNFEESRGRRVFIVHGHNSILKQQVADFLRKLGFEAIILHEQADGGRTIIEKFLAHADKVDFAVILATGDDLGSRKTDESSAARLRARQNVILEMGFFIARLGRERVFVLRERDVEMPSDFDGVLYTLYEADNDWQANLVRELRYVGYTIEEELLS